MKQTIIALLIGASLLHTHAADINVSELRDKMPVGQLGKPLGSRIVLTGKSPERAVLLTNPLEATEVDGKPLAAHVTIEIRGELQIQDGVTYQLDGYEAGEFSGPPVWLNSRMQTIFQYRSFYVVTKVIAPAPKSDAIAQLVAKLSAMHGLWKNGTFIDLRMPESASPEQIVEQVFKVTGFDKGYVKEYKLVKDRSVQIFDEAYTAAEVQTDLGKKIVLFTAGGRWNRAYDADDEASPLKSAQLPAADSPQAIAAATRMGAETAGADIKAGVFRILYSGIQLSVPADEATGYRLQHIGDSCIVGSAFRAEKDAYNQAMRDWHAKNPLKPKP